MLFLAALSGCMNGNYDANVVPPFVMPEVTLTEADVLIKQDAGKRVFAVAVGSASLSESLRTALSEQGLVLVPDRAQAEVVYELDGLYQAIRQSGRTAQVSLGSFSENPNHILTKRAGSSNLEGPFYPNDMDTKGGPLWQQSVFIVLKRTAANEVSTSSVSVKLPAIDRFMRPYSFFHTGLEALSKSIGLPKGSLATKRPVQDYRN